MDHMTMEGSDVVPGGCIEIDTFTVWRKLIKNIVKTNKIGVNPSNITPCHICITELEGTMLYGTSA